jgi:heat shock protein HtpX
MAVRTVVLFGVLTGLFLFIGFLIAGTAGMVIAFVFAVIMNFVSYWYSDTIVLKIYRAKEITKRQNPQLHKIVEEVAKEADIPKPKVYLIDTDVPNAFATGRNPQHASVAVTKGIMNTLEPTELEAVLGHEISHVKNRDILTTSVAATLGGAIAFIAQMAWFGLIGGNDRNGGSIVLLPMLILAPIAATLIQLGISRSREYAADYDGAILTKNPIGLASALQKIENSVKQKPLRGNSAYSSLFFVNPFKADAFASLFSTHPPTAQRIERLKQLAKTM